LRFSVRTRHRVFSRCRGVRGRDSLLAVAVHGTELIVGYSPLKITGLDEQEGLKRKAQLIYVDPHLRDQARVASADRHAF
jgi:hypothetical protein